MGQLSDLREANLTRQKEWDPNNFANELWRSNELAGETGEACNVVKKLYREKVGVPGSRDTVAHLAEELADVIICVDLLAGMYGINLWDAVRNKFNATSAKNNLVTRL